MIVFREFSTKPSSKYLITILKNFPKRQGNKNTKKDEDMPRLYIYIEKNSVYLTINLCPIDNLSERRLFHLLICATLTLLRLAIAPRVSP